MFTRRRLEIFVEFLLFGVVMGVAEDLIAVYLSTGEPITWHIIGIVILVAIPFAVIGEIIVDKQDLFHFYKLPTTLRSGF
jgi:hypothetical protein